MPQTLVVFSCDQRFFPLAKGLVLSLEAGGTELNQQGIGLVFLDLGCAPASLDWLRNHRVQVTRLDQEALGPLSRAAQGYLRAEVCRPLLPKLFPGHEAFIWLDTDLWVQAPETLSNLARFALAQPASMFICPEWHYGYSNLNENFSTNQIENFAAYYRAIYDDTTAREMAGRPLLNTGVFAMAASSPLWNLWWDELVQVYARDAGKHEPRIRHLAEQIALNVLVRRKGGAVQVDPIYNYLCMWGLPFRDNNDIVRVALPPADPIGIVHLPLWNIWGKTYFEHGLLYQRGSYLTDDEKRSLLP